MGFQSWVSHFWALGGLLSGFYTHFVKGATKNLGVDSEWGFRRVLGGGLGGGQFIDINLRDMI